MVLVTVNFHAASYLHERTVDAHVQVTLAPHGLKELTVMSLTIPDKWSKDEYFPIVIVVKNQFNHFFFRIFYHFLTCGIAVGTSGTGEEQSHVVVYLCSGSYSGTWIFIGGLLLDTDDW